MHNFENLKSLFLNILLGKLFIPTPIQKDIFRAGYNVLETCDDSVVSSLLCVQKHLSHKTMCPWEGRVTPADFAETWADNSAQNRDNMSHLEAQP